MQQKLTHDPNSRASPQARQLRSRHSSDRPARQQDTATPDRRGGEPFGGGGAAPHRGEKNVAVLDTRAVAMGITAIVEVHLSNERLQTVDAAKALFRDAPEVQQCYYVTGGTSFVLIIVSPDMVSYEATTRRLFAQNDAVASFRTLVALDRVKTGSEIVVP
jgi:Lrp/AsnC family transcriptional regulator, leucine-responsive regulatory protein